MSRVVKVTNTTSETKTWLGSAFDPSASRTLIESEIAYWKRDAYVFESVSKGEVLIGDGTEDFIDPVQGWEWLTGAVVMTKVCDTQLTEVQKVQKVAIYKAEGSSFINVTFDLTDKTTWFQEASRVADMPLALISGKDYQAPNTFLIDAVHGKIYMEDSLTENALPSYLGGVLKYKVIIKDNGIVINEGADVVIDYITGKFSLLETYTPVGEITATYYYAGSSMFTIKPDEGTVIHIEHSELQFTKDLVMSAPIHFDIYVYNPYDLPNKVLYKRTTYKNIKDIINAANLGTGVIDAVDILTNDVLVFPFDYATLKSLKHSEGAELRISVEGDVPFTGEWGTATFYLLKEDQ